MLKKISFILFLLCVTCIPAQSLDEVKQYS